VDTDPEHDEPVGEEGEEEWTPETNYWIKWQTMKEVLKPSWSLGIRKEV